MQKEFDKWNVQKKSIDDRGNAPYYHERDIWWCSLGVNVGFEQDGSGDEFRRPVLVMKGLSQHTCLVVPLTASAQMHPLRFPIGSVDGKDAHALLSQMRVVDTKRLVRKISRLNNETFDSMKKAVQEFISTA